MSLAIACVSVVIATLALTRSRRDGLYYVVCESDTDTTTMTIPFVDISMN